MGAGGGGRGTTAGSLMVHSATVSRSLPNSTPSAAASSAKEGLPLHLGQPLPTETPGRDRCDVVSASSAMAPQPQLPPSSPSPLTPSRDASAVGAVSSLTAPLLPHPARGGDAMEDGGGEADVTAAVTVVGKTGVVAVVGDVTGGADEAGGDDTAIDPLAGISSSIAVLTNAAAVSSPSPFVNINTSHDALDVTASAADQSRSASNWEYGGGGGGRIWGGGG